MLGSCPWYEQKEGIEEWRTADERFAAKLACSWQNNGCNKRNDRLVHGLCLTFTAIMTITVSISPIVAPSSSNFCRELLICKKSAALLGRVAEVLTIGMPPASSSRLGTAVVSTVWKACGALFFSPMGTCRYACLSSDAVNECIRGGAMSACTLPQQILATMHMGTQLPNMTRFSLLSIVFVLIGSCEQEGAFVREGTALH